MLISIIGAATVLILIVLLLELSKGKKPIATKAELSSSVVEAGQMIVVYVDAKNRQFRDAVVVPGYHCLRGGAFSMDGVGFFFKPDGSDHHPRIKFTGLQLDPIWEKIGPRESRRYEFHWKPRESDVGEGILFLTLPDDFEPVGPFNVRVLKSGESG